MFVGGRGADEFNAPLFRASRGLFKNIRGACRRVECLDNGVEDSSTVRGEIIRHLGVNSLSRRPVASVHSSDVGTAGGAGVGGAGSGGTLG